MLATMLLALAQRSSFSERGDMSAAVWAKAVAIQCELSQPGIADWAGDYGDILIAPNSGVVTCFRSCMRPYYSAASVRVEGHRLEFEYDRDSPNAGVWWVVPWGERRYLVREARLRLFCMDVNDGSEPRNYEQPSPALRASDLRRAAHGRPELPEPWQHLLLSSPLQTSILHVERKCVTPSLRATRTTATRVLLRLGAQDGVRVDLGFHLGNSGRLRGFVESVEPSACVVLVDEGYDGQALRLKPGDYAGTKRPW